jgi:hypothetical protein
VLAWKTDTYSVQAPFGELKKKPSMTNMHYTTFQVGCCKKVTRIDAHMIALTKNAETNLTGV